MEDMDSLYKKHGAVCEYSKNRRVEKLIVYLPQQFSSVTEACGPQQQIFMGLMAGAAGRPHQPCSVCS